MGAVLSVALAISVPLGVGVYLSIQNKDEINNWYPTLKKPSWTPPNKLFGPVWTALYTMMGIGSYIVWKNGGGIMPKALYCAQLVLNFAWTPLFFKKHELGYAMADISALLGFLTATIIEFHRVSPTASYLLLPYLGWSSYAAALTYNIWKNNPKGGDNVKTIALQSVDEGKAAYDAVEKEVNETASKTQAQIAAADKQLAEALKAAAPTVK